ncbi:MAG TPA: cytidine deaminase [Vicinamibacterales bacterium]|nr:cytidine deaminase [Vicinamibacterales bacterium]
MTDQSVVSVVALEITDGQEREFLGLTGQLQALVRNKGYGTNQLLQDGSHPRRYYDIRIWRNADAASKAEADIELNALRRDMAKHLQSTPLVDVAWAVEVGLAAAGPWQERRQVTDRRAVGERHVGSMSFSGPERRVTERRAGPRPMIEPVPITFPDAAEGNQGRSVRPTVVHAARVARERAIAAFSEFKVGAALETVEGRIITGCNIENSTYGLTMCAERVAIFKALSDGHRAFKRIAIVADTAQTTSPCGACRQMLWEFAGDIEVILADLTSIKTTHQLKDLLPHPFDARFIE